MPLFLKHILLAKDFAAQFFKARMAYRVDFFMSLLANFITTSLSFVFIVVVFQKIPVLKGWNFYEVLFIYGYALIPIGLFNLVSLNFWDFGGRYIVDGAFDRVMLRPLYPLYQVVFESFRVESVQDMTLGVVISLIAADRLGLDMGLLDAVLFFGFALCGATILISFFAILAAVNFRVEDRVGIGVPVYNVINLSRYPLTLYSTAIKFILCTVIPFAFLSFFPSMYFLNRREFVVFLWLAPVAAGLFFLLACLAWRKGIRRYTSTGS